MSAQERPSDALTALSAQDVKRIEKLIIQSENDAQAELDECSRWRLQFTNARTQEEKDAATRSEGHHRTLAQVYYYYVRQLKALSILDAVLAQQGRLLEGWQPIETAPKDGTVIVVWNPREPSLCKFARWGFAKYAPKSSGWVSIRRGCFLSNLPALWMRMPLPSPPVSHAETEQP